MYKKKIASLLALVMLLGILTGCGVVQNEPTGQQNTAQDSAASTTNAQSRPLDGADIVLKLSHADNDTSMLANTWNCYARTFRSRLETLSGGTMTVDIYPNSQLGDETSTL